MATKLPLRRRLNIIIADNVAIIVFLSGAADTLWRTVVNAYPRCGVAAMKNVSCPPGENSESRQTVPHRDARLIRYHPRERKKRFVSTNLCYVSTDREPYGRNNKTRWTWYCNFRAFSIETYLQFVFFVVLQRMFVAWHDLTAVWDGLYFFFRIYVRNSNLFRRMFVVSH